jgi:hypothetical protein
MILVLTSRRIQGQEFAVNVVDNLTETSLDLATSIVRPPFCCSVPRELDAIFFAALARYLTTPHELCRRFCLS